MKKLMDFWKRDKRYSTMIKAVLLALLPVLCCVARCAMDGRSIGDVWLPGSEWNDELFYYKQVEGIINFGYPQGYFGFNESHALKLSFAAWSPVLVFPWIIWGFLFGWNLLSPVVCNIVLLSLACFLFVWLVKPAWKQLGIMALLFWLYTPFTRQMLSGMAELICFSVVIVFFGLAVNYLNAEKTWKLVLLFVFAAVMTLMRPYMLLFLVLPSYLWIRRAKWKGILGSAAIMGVTLAVYACIKHYLGAEYFAPLFFTDWIEAFFQQGLFGGIRYTLGKLYYMGIDLLSHIDRGLRTGLASGAYFASYFVMFGVLVGQSLAEGRRWKRLKKAGDEQEAKKPGNRLVIQVFLIFCFFAMLMAVLLMYKLTEGSRHLLTFMAAGIFVIALMDTRYFKKAVLIGLTFFYFFSYKAEEPYYYGIPHVQEESAAQLAVWQRTFEEKLQLKTEPEVPNFDNSVIWVFNDVLSDGTNKTTAWQMLYALPKGFGVSCCMPDYIVENFDALQSGYIAIPSEGRIDSMCQAAGYEEIGREGDLVIYRLP